MEKEQAQEIINALSSMVVVLAESPEIMKNVAKIVRALYVALLQEGFSAEQALALAVALAPRKS